MNESHEENGGDSSSASHATMITSMEDPSLSTTLNLSNENDDKNECDEHINDQERIDDSLSINSTMNKEQDSDIIVAVAEEDRDDNKNRSLIDDENKNEILNGKEEEDQEEEQKNGDRIDVIAGTSANNGDQITNNKTFDEMENKNDNDTLHETNNTQTSGNNGNLLVSSNSSGSDSNDAKAKESETREVKNKNDQNHWIKSILIVSFDVQDGHVIEYLVGKISEESQTKITTLSLPDSNSGQNGDVQYCFRFRIDENNTNTLPILALPANNSEKHDSKPLKNKKKTSLFSQSPLQHQYLFGYVFFRQIKDPSRKRGYFQKSLVIISDRPYVVFFQACARIIGPLYF